MSLRTDEFELEILDSYTQYTEMYNMQTHRMLMFTGAMLLIMTFLINTYHTEPEFNFAYITGVIMIGVFLYSFYLFYAKNGRR